MTKQERQSIIAQLSLMTRYAESYYEKMTDKQLAKELEKQYGEEIL